MVNDGYFLETEAPYLSGPGLGQVADDDDFLGRGEGADHLTNLEDKFFGEASFVVRIICKFAVASRQIQQPDK